MEPTSLTTVRVCDGGDLVRLELSPDGSVAVIRDDGATDRTLASYRVVGFDGKELRLGADCFTVDDETDIDALHSLVNAASRSMTDRIHGLEHGMEARTTASTPRAPSKPLSHAGAWIILGAILLGPILTYLLAVVMATGKSSSPTRCDSSEDPYFRCAFDPSPRDEAFAQGLVAGAVITILVLIVGIIVHFTSRIDD